MALSTARSKYKRKRSADYFTKRLLASVRGTARPKREDFYFGRLVMGFWHTVARRETAFVDARTTSSLRRIALESFLGISPWPQFSFLRVPCMRRCQNRRPGSDYLASVFQRDAFPSSCQSFAFRRYRSLCEAIYWLLSHASRVYGLWFRCPITPGSLSRNSLAPVLPSIARVATLVPAI